MLITSLSIKPVEDGYRPVDLGTDRGPVECRYYPASWSTRGVLMVGGASGGWDSPACKLYPVLSDDLTAQGISVLRVRFRLTESLEAAVLDILAGLAYLESEGVKEAALVGHAFGGAATIQAAALNPIVRTVVALATQSFGAEPVAELSPHCSILLVHGDSDPVLPPYCSEWAYFLAGDPKRLVVFEGAGHDLNEVAQEVRSLVLGWICEQLGS